MDMRFGLITRFYKDMHSRVDYVSLEFCDDMLSQADYMSPKFYEDMCSRADHVSLEFCKDVTYMRRTYRGARRCRCTSRCQTKKTMEVLPRCTSWSASIGGLLKSHQGSISLASNTIEARALMQKEL
ncbi:unnamed protein product [Prunus armeniaca]